MAQILKDRLVESQWRWQTVAGPRLYAAAGIIELAYGHWSCGELR